MERTLSCPTPAARRPGLWFRFVYMLRARRQLRDLANLDDHMLKDIGIDRATAARELERPVWNAPNHWHR